MKQAAFTIVTAVDGAADLTALLDQIGDSIAENELLRFADLSDLHFASLSVVATGTDTPYLVFEGNVDGTRDAFLDQLVSVAPEAIDNIYVHAVDYPPEGSRTRDAVVAYLVAHDIGFNTFYVARPGWSVEELRREQLLHDRIEALLEGLDPASAACATPEGLHQWIGQQVRADPDLTWAATPASVPFLVQHGTKVLAGAGGAAALALLGVVRVGAGRPGGRRLAARAGLAALVGGVLGAFVKLNLAEAEDDRRDRDRDPDWLTAYELWTGAIGRIQAREDVQVQNHMISVTQIKPGRFRHGLLRLVLFVINAAARVVANRGVLGGIGSIHFARWVITRDGQHLIFLSNYDGSWESYLGDFIDRASQGLTAVWSNTDNAVGFPRTRFLITEGARDEVRFKYFARLSMVPTNTWYSAYPSLTVVNILNNIEIHNGLFATLDRDGAQAWLRRL